jgi:ATP-dependent helicase/nuclease subunit A
LQLSLIEALRGTETNLFLVGDEFQSIYGFRHADLEVFREQRERFAASDRAELLPLRGNFRSRPEIVAAANAIGSRMLDGFTPLTVGRAPESAEPAGDGPAVELLLTERRGWDTDGIDLQLPVDDRTPKECVAEARFLAGRLRELTEDGGVPRKDVVLLLRAFTHVDAFEEALERAGLRPYVVGGRGYWSQQQVEDVRCLLSVIANPLDDEPLLGALASPACGALPDTLWILRRASGSGKHLWRALERAAGAWEPELEDAEWLERLPEAEVRKLGLFHARIARLRAEAPRLALEELIDRAVADTGYDLAVLMRGSGELRLANLRKLLRMAREFEADEGRDLRGFLEFVSFQTADDEEAVAATEAEDHDGVRVMTIHTAKGLEFPVVAVAGLGRDLLRGGRGADLDIGGGPPLRVGMRWARLGAPSVDLYERAALQEEAGKRESAEELRLFYVAATRARDRLLLSGLLAPERPRELKPGTCVSERLLQAFEVEEVKSGSTVSLPAAPAAPGLDASFGDAEVAVRINPPSPERVAELVRVASAKAPPVELAGGPPPIVERRAPVTPRRPLSYTTLRRYRRCGYRFYAETVLGLAPTDMKGSATGREAGQEFGEAVHGLLEWSASRRWIRAPAEVTRRFLAAREADSDPDAPQRATKMVDGWIDSPLRAELSQRGTALSAEARFMVELGGSLVRGTLDLLAQPREGGPTVVDYKTDRLEGVDPHEHARRYEIQRDLYALAAGSATGAESVRVAYVYLERPEAPVIHEFDRAAIEAVRAGIEDTVAAIASGRFEVTETPDWGLCHDCPARARLCSAPAQPPASAKAA